MEELTLPRLIASVIAESKEDEILDIALGEQQCQSSVLTSQDGSMARWIEKIVFQRENGSIYILTRSVIRIGEAIKTESWMSVSLEEPSEVLFNECTT